jgi:hypothetical protein
MCAPQGVQLLLKGIADADRRIKELQEAQAAAAAAGKPAP